ncbi:hypothetical protein [Marivita sp.]|uniref:hypothetical protein n=1 Tax=Marivita sp. TaxID=2003365 RepID=UPI0025C0BCDB|nr:hypothetical protein [Marivita sp.]
MKIRGPSKPSSALVSASVSLIRVDLLIMRDNIRAISAILPDGIRARFNGDDPKPRPYAGSEGTLAYFTGLELSLVHLPGKKVTGICHFSGLPRGGASIRSARYC